MEEKDLVNSNNARIIFLTEFLPLIMLEITVLMLGGVSQQHEILLDLIIKYTAKLAEMLKSELRWVFFFLPCFVLLLFQCCSGPLCT